MAAWLATQRHRVNRKRIQRLMRLTGLVAIYQRPSTPAPKSKVYSRRAIIALLTGLLVDALLTWLDERDYCGMPGVRSRHSRR
jgi:putative transposase